MSSIIFQVCKEEAVVVTDTLAVTPEGIPHSFCSKAQYIPHLKMIVAGVGVGSFSNLWASKLTTNLLASDIDHVNHHAQSALKELWRNFKNENDIGDDNPVTTTIYHIGVSRTTNEIHSYVYRSANDFESEVIPNNGAYRYKPERLNEFDPDKTLLEQSIQIMLEQRERESKEPAKSRLYIGGEAIAQILRVDGTCVTTPLHKFEDFDLCEKKMYENFNK